MGTLADSEAMHRRGVDLANLGRYADALRVLRIAFDGAHQGGDVNLMARAAGTIAYVLARTGDVDAGERLCLDMLSRDDLDAVTIAQLHGQLGALALERGLLEQAVDWLSKGVDGLKEHPVRQANVLMNRGLVEMDRGRLDAARADLELAEQIYREAGLSDEANQAVHNLGYLAMRGGDLVTALSLMQRVRDPLDDESDVWAAINELDRAEVLRDAGLVTDAERLLSTVATVLGRHRAPRERAGAEYQLARSLLTHSPERAATVSRAAARRFRALGSEGWALRAEAIALRARLAVDRIDRSGRPIASARRLPSVRAVDETVAQLRAHRFLAEAEALALTDTLARIRRSRRASMPLPRVPRRMPLEVTMLAAEVRAAAAAVSTREADCRREAAAGLELLERTQATFGSLDLQTSSAMRATGLLTVGLASALRSRRPEVIFEWSERARLMSQRVLPLRPPPNPELAADLSELRTIRAAASDGDWLADPRAAALHRRAQERQWSSAASAGLTGRISLSQLQAALAPEEMLVTYVFDGTDLVALAVSGGEATMIDLSLRDVGAALVGLRADLDVAASVTSGPLAEVVRMSLRERLGRISSLLVEPLGAALQSARRIVLLTPGVLAGIPWSMLPGLRGHAVAVAGSASAWAENRSRGELRHSSAGFVVGPRVARGDEEVAAAAVPWTKSPILLGDAARVGAVTALASQVDVLHIAAHGRHAVDNPMFSGLELADGTLFGYDIDLIENVPDTVILSACEVGRSSVRWGEEAVGMTRVWLHAGARCVVAAPVVVADDDACELLAAMHEGLAAGIPPSVALAEASERTGIVAPFQVHGAGF
ncbi:CHAT domain-containing protein [Microbacterium jejuense]|uniref:CHAT domain-containing protein n=1 Tax=Microbacterium jejuense TaxID=1263637 RepID=A0ABS7HTN4_9MICO|nr:CHAT domain-containing protein [Microbacterium jejuense]MBW9095606.1 CHAT domain-containing protein [Microbacterium jejuense]